MNARRALACALAAALLVAGREARAGTRIEPDAVARDVIDAATRGDGAAVARAARARVPDPFLVAGELRRVALESSGDPADAAWRAFETFADAAGEGSVGTGLRALRERWRRASTSELDAERSRIRLREALRTRAATDRAEDLLATIDAARGTLSDPSDYWVLRIRGLEAILLTRVGRSPADEATWRDVGRAALAIGWSEFAGSAHAEAGMLATERLDDASAADDRKTAADAYEAAGDRGSASGIRLTLARSLARLDRPEEAARALALAESSGALEADAMGHAQWARAVIERASGRDAEASSLLARAIETFLAANDPETAARALTELGHAHREGGRAGDAIAALERALVVIAASPSPAATVRALVRSEYSALLVSLRRFPEALAHADAGLEAAIETGRPALIAVARLDRATVLGELGRNEEALREQRALRRHWLATGNARAAAGARLNESSTLWRLQRHEEAEAAAVEARDEAIAAGDRRMEAQARSGHGLIVYSRGDLPGALAIQRGAVAAFAALRDRSRSAASAHRILARLLERSERFSEALEVARATLAIQRAIADGLVEADGAGARADARLTCDLGVFAALRMLRKEPARAPEAAIAAFAFAEAGRALALSQGLANPAALLTSALPADVGKADADSRDTLARARRRFEVSLRRSPDDPEARGAVGELERAWIARDEVVVRVQRAAQRAAAFIAPPPADPAALAAALAPDTAFVLYHLGLEAGAAIVVRSTGVELVELGSTTDVRSAAQAWLRVASAPGSEDERPGLALARRVFGPLRGRLEGVTHLVISPDDALSFVPFEALPLSDGDRTVRLVERFDVAYVPSAGVWNALRAERSFASEAILAIGNPTLARIDAAGDGVRRGAGLATLPGGEEEARAVAEYAPVDHRRLLVGADATLGAVTKALDDKAAAFRAIHFACHALVDPARPRGTGLVLTGGDLLDVDRIARSRWKADLVVIAACESARGEFSRGEGVIGLPRALFLSGVPRAIVSQWVVSDRATAPFMRRFYEEALGKRVGTAAALRAAKVAAIHAGGSDAHPSAWAPFVLWGRGD